MFKFVKVQDLKKKRNIIVLIFLVFYRLILAFLYLLSIVITRSEITAILFDERR